MYYFIYNPTAGGGFFEKQVKEFRELLYREVPQHYFAITEKPQDAFGLIRDAAKLGFHTVVVIGGDGTLHEAIQWLAIAKGKTPAIGIIPTGKQNLFAKSLGITFSPENNITQLKAGKMRNVDIGKVVDHNVFFINALTVGIAKHKSDEGHVLGFLKPLFSQQTTLTLQAAPVEIIEGDQVFTARTGVASVVNAGWVLESGNFPVSPDDGYLNTFLFSHLDDPEVATLLQQENGISRTMEFITHKRSQSVVLKKPPLQVIRIDGEPYELGDEIAVELLPGKFKVLSPSAQQLPLG